MTIAAKWWAEVSGLWEQQTNECQKKTPKKTNKQKKRIFRGIDLSM
jgi:hypothetical protein